MEDNSEKLIKDFDNKIHLYKGLAERTHILLNSLIENSIKPHQLEFRLKDKDSFSKKLIRKNFKYKSLEQVTDILGFRLVTYFEDDIDIIENIIKKEFEIDYKNSIDKRKMEVDKFGYRSVHYVVSLNKERLKLTEYKDYKKIKFEIQIRSILQHSWAEIEHDIGYKGASEIPSSAKRTFYRVAALLEQADIEFTKLRLEIKEYEKNIEKELTNENLNIQLSKSSLIAFIKGSKVLEEIEKTTADRINCNIGDDIDSGLIGNKELIQDLHNLNIKTVNELEKSLIKNREEIMISQDKFLQIYDKNVTRPKSSMTFIKGAPILWLRNLLKK
jgi:putative GTP pyrophosphokinase